MAAVGVREQRFGALALGVVLAAACTDTGVRPTSSVQSADTADQIMLKMSTQLTEKGVLRSFVEADTAYLYQIQQQMDLRHFKVRMLDAQGNLQSTLTAQHGIYLSYNGKLDARGNVLVESTDGRRLQTEHLIYDKAANQIRSDTVFTYDSPTAHGSGKGFTTDINFRNVQIDQPKGTQKGKGILLPGQ
jgi:LPS export ABC transporter protein LptC